MSSSSTSTGPEETTFPLLRLPVELLQYTIDLVHAGKPSRLHCLPSGTVTTSDPLSLVNKQLREECISSLLRSAPVVEAYVLGFDFRNVVTFFNKLSESELLTFAAKENDEVLTASSGSRRRGNAIDRVALSYTSERQMTIVLDFTPACSWTLDDVQRWLRRTQHPTKKGTKMDIQYAVHSPQRLRDWKNCRQWVQMAWYAGRAGRDQAAAELDKMIKAILTESGHELTLELWLGAIC